MNIPNFDSVRVLVVGDVMLDKYILGEITRISPESPTPIINPTERKYVVGGAGNVAVNLSSLGCETTFIGITGNDTNSTILSKLLSDNKISTHLINDDKRTTTIKTRVVSQGRQLLRVDDEDTLAVKDDILTEVIEAVTTIIYNVDVVVLSDYNKGMFNNNLAKVIINKCRLSNIPVFVDPKGLDWHRYYGATCITPNVGEFLDAGGLNTANTLNVGYVLVTKGADGMTLISKDGETHIPTTAKSVYDVSGAGDTVIATLAGAHGAGVSIQDAVHIANIAAGIVVGIMGTSPITKELLISEMNNIGRT